MLLVGRELHLDGRAIFCRECLWNGLHLHLQTGLIQVQNSKIHYVAYRCPECSGFDLGLRGKLLSFKAQNCLTNLQDHKAIENSHADHQHNGNTEKRDTR
jgi:hypothetical protein